VRRVNCSKAPCTCPANRCRLLTMEPVTDCEPIGRGVEVGLAGMRGKTVLPRLAQFAVSEHSNFDP
jgi:hypothetical protein